MLVFKQLHTRPSLTQQVRVNFGLWEGWVHSCLLTDIDQNISSWKELNLITMVSF